MIARYFELALPVKPADKWLQSVVNWTWKIKLSLQMETEVDWSFA